MSDAAFAQERQVTLSPKSHKLDNNDNFSLDSRFLCYDTREQVGSGIGNGQSIEKVEVATGIETVLYAPPSVIGEKPAPGVGAVSYSPIANEVAFIHGPPLEEVAARGSYDKANRTGALVLADGSGTRTWLECRDIDTSRDTLPGAHRGGSHRHEFTLDGKRIGFTYDDFLLPKYDRTIAYMEPSPKAPKGYSHYFAVLVSVAPMGQSKPGELEKAAGDSWIGKQGLMRAFIGKVRAKDGVAYEESLFVVDVPANVDITTADSGSATRYPAPPKGLTVRRLTQSNAAGVVRGTVQGDRIAYYGKAPDGTTQVFIIPSDGSEEDANPANRPVQATRLPGGAGSGLRWHPSGNSIACTSNDGIVVTCVAPGPRFGESTFLTPQNDGERGELVWSPDGTLFAYTKVVPSFDADGKHVKTYEGKDFQQIFVLPFPDANKDGIVDK